MQNPILTTETLSRALIANLPGGAAFVVDRDLRYLLAEGEALATAGFKPEDFVGRTIFEVLPPDLAASYEPMYRQSLAGEPFEHEHQAHEHTYISRGTPLRSDGGEVYAVLVVSYDISDRKRVEDDHKQADQALRESEARLQSIANLVPDLLWDSEPDGSNNWYNQRWMEYTGQTFEQAIGWGWTDAIHPDDREGSARRYREAVEQGMPLLQEHRIRRHDGTYRWFVVKASPLKDERGKVIKMYSAATDIHEQRVALEALRESGAKYRSLFNAMDEGYMLSEVIFDKHDKPIDILYLEANPAAIRLAGRDFAGRRMREIDPNYEEYWYEIYGRVALTGRAVREERYAEPHGRWFDFYAFKVGEPESRRVATVFQDITDRKRQEEALRETEERLRDVLNSMSEGFALLAGDFTILDVNEETLRLDGRSRDELIGCSHWDAFPGTEDSPVGEIFKRVVRERISASLEHLYRWPDERALWLDMRAYPTQNDGVAIFWRDVTDRKQAEAALRESEAKYRSLFNSMDEAYAVVEVMAGENGEWNDFLFLEVNPAFVKQTGMEYPVGRKATELLGTPNPQWAQVYGRVAETGEPIRFEEGEATLGRVFDLYVFRLGGEGSRRVAVLFADITDRKLAEAQLRRAAEMDAFRLKLSDALRSLTDPVQIQAEACRLLGEQLGADRAYYVEVHEPEGYARVNRHYSRGDSPSIVGNYRLSEYGWSLPIMRRGETIVITDTQSTDIIPDFERAAMARIGMIGFVAIPLIKGEVLVGSLAVNEPTPRKWTEAEVDLVRETAERIWADIQRAHAETALRQSEAKYRSLFESIDEGFCLIEIVRDEMGAGVDYRLLEANGVFERQTGVVNARGKLASEFAPGEETFWLENYDRVARTGEAERLENYHQPTKHWYTAFIVRVGGEDSNRVAIVFDDITDRKNRELNVAFLDEIGQELSRLSASDEIIQTVGARVGEFLGLSGCYFVDVDEAKNEVTVHYGWGSEKLPSLKQTFKLEDYLTEDFIHTMRAGEVFLMRDTTQDERAEAENYARLKVASFVTVPFLHNGRYTGHIAVTSEKPRDWQPQEIELLQEIASRVFPRIERARAEAALRESEEALAADLANEELLRELAVRLIIEENVTTIYDEILSATIAIARADAGTIQIYDPPTKSLELIASKNFSRTITDYFYHVDASSRTACGIAMTIGQRTLVDFPDEVADFGCQLLINEGIQAALALPLVSRTGTPLGMLNTHWQETRHRPTDRELRFLDLLARQAADLIEQRQAEAAVRESEAKYRSLFESINDGFALLEVLYDDDARPVDCRYLEVSPSFETQTGLPQAQGKTFRELIPSVEPGWFEHYHQALVTNAPVHFEMYQSHIKIWFEVDVSPYGNPQDRQVTIVFQNINDRKRAEEELKQAEAANTADFIDSLSSSGEMGKLIRSMDWSKTPLGPIESWPQSLRTTVSLCLASNFPVNIIWGSGRVQIYNDGYWPICGDKHPHSMGQDLKESWLSAWDVVGEPFERATAGETAFLENQQIFLDRNGYLEETFFTFSFSPIREETGGVGGVFHPVTEVTQQTLAERRLKVLRDLAEHTADAKTLEEACGSIAQSLAAHALDLPFTLLYRLDPDGKAALVGMTGLKPGSAVCPRVIDLEGSPAWALAEVTRFSRGEVAPTVMADQRSSGQSRQVNGLEQRFGAFQCSPYPETPQSAIVMPIALPGLVHPWGIFVAGVSPRRALDEAYQTFYTLLGKSVKTVITNAYVYEEERKRAESLAELDRAKTTFFSNVSHEFRTPLTLSLAPLQDALSDRTHPLAPVHRERLELVHRNNLRLSKLVNTLLDFSRIEAGRMEAVYEPTDLATYTAELSSVFRSAIERAGLQLIVDCPPLPEPVFVDREMWEKIVLNLLSNAFKFTFEGEIRVSLHSTDSHQAILQIQDTGTGIAPEHLPHLFERFYQVRGTQARTHEGSGIGLALVHELVRLQGGTIEVSSTLTEGTCFTVSLLFGTDHLPSDRLQSEGDRYPVRTLASTAMGATAYVEEAERWLPTQNNQDQTIENTEEQTTQTADSSLPNHTSARVLVVDDNADIREYLTRILSEHVQVEAVADGTTALAAAQERVPDLILSDVMMPGLDGFELLEALRADPRTREIPIILLSARAGAEAIIEGLEAGADDYLIKPFSAQELISRVTAHLQIAQLRGEALQEARSTLRSRDEFISVVSHELNTPLVSILGWTRLLRSSPPNPVMLSKALNTIERNAMLQAKLVQDLLDLSRISAGKFCLHPQPIELQPVIETAIATVTQTATDKGIHLTWQENVTEPVFVMGDSDRLSQVLINFLTNAIKFTPLSGSVKVELSLMNDDTSADASYVEIRVIDTGIGIAADFLPHVFERFRQAERAHSVKGLGLGLAIAHYIVELHNGTIHADSAGVGQGATFIVRLPLLQNSDDLI